MRPLALLLLLGFALAATAAGLPVAEPCSVSTSHQFLVYGGDILLRGAVSDLAEQTKSNVLQMLGLRDTWKTPLIIRLDFPRVNFPDAPSTRLEVSQLGYGLKLQLDLLLAGAVRGPEIQRQLLRAILVEMIYREGRTVAPGTRYVVPPDWLLDGLLALQPGRVRDQSAQLLRTFVNTNRIAPLEDIVRQDRTKLDPASRELFNAYSKALVQLLLEAPNGRRKLVQYLTDLPDAPNDALADLVVHFPERLGRAPEKWWTVSVANLSASDRYEVLSAIETAARLDELLRFSIAGSDGVTHRYSLADFPKFEKAKAARPLLGQVARQLLLLGARAHPSYRLIVQEDCLLVERLARGHPHGVRKRLERAASYRQLVETQIEAIGDYLNWYEATQIKTMSGVFAQLLDSSEMEKPIPARRDPISLYLDSLELEMR